jgi:DNA-binding response OmpR family regulator
MWETGDGGIKVDLSANEYQLLTMLASEPGRVFTKAELLRSPRARACSR